MKNLFFLCLLSFCIASCGSEDDCTPETIVGTYIGNSECDDTTSTDISLNEGPVTFTIESLGDNNYSATNQDGDATVFVADGCNLTIPDLEFEFFGIMIKTSGNGEIDGSQLNLNIITTVDGESFSCNIVATKQ